MGYSVGSLRVGHDGATDTYGRVGHDGATDTYGGRRHGGTVLEALAYYVPPLLGKVIKPLFPFHLKKGKERE